ncbi:MAG: hypothetical protein ACRD82_05315, partial [Blastocatellia bacterium]
MPIAFYEIADLATRGETAVILPLIQSVIEVTQAQPGSLRELATRGNQLRVICYDLETLNTVEQAGGWTAYDKLGVSVLCAYDSAENRYRVFSDVLPEAWRAVYQAETLADFGRLAEQSQCLVGFNSARFDRQVLRESCNIWLPQIDYDLLIEGWIGQGLDPNPEQHTDEYKGGLNDYARANLGVEKSSSGE